jgi:crotonobetainyl-CoA:carnitine CoA-transferase CaiB-like acyl-CoA transferase
VPISDLAKRSTGHWTDVEPSFAPGSAGPLAGVRVIDLSDTFMAPYATLLLAQMGAEVIKVELPRGDITRQIGDTEGSGLGPYFISANRGKLSIALDLRSDADYETFTRLVERSDVFVHNRRPNAAAKLRIDYDTLRPVNPRLIHTSAVGYSSGGPYRDRAAYDDVIQAACGLVSVQGAGGEPSYVRSVVADKTTGLMLFGAILAALFERERSGQGQAVEVPMFETMVSFVLLDQQGGLVFDPPKGPSGYARTSSPYRRPYQTADGVISVMVYTDAQWRAFFDEVGKPELADDTRFATMRARTEHIDALYAHVEEELAHRSTHEWLKALEERGIPASAVNSIEDVLADPHIRAVGLIESEEYPGLGTVRTARLPVGFSRTPVGPVRHAPAVGEDDEAIRSSLAGPRRCSQSPAAEQ